MTPEELKTIIDAAIKGTLRQLDQPKRPTLLPLNVVAHRLRVPVRWLRAEAEAGRIPSLRADNHFLCDPEAVEAALLIRARRGSYKKKWYA